MEIKEDNIIISNIDKYIISFYNGNMILTKKNKKIDIEKIQNIDFKFSVLLNCNVNNIDLEYKKYKPVLFYIYKLIDNSELIFENTLLKIKKEKFITKGYEYIKDLNISVQSAESNKIIKEIIHMTKLCNIDINIKIKLSTNEIINI